jgi:hypothetical protein
MVITHSSHTRCRKECSKLKLILLLNEKKKIIEAVIKLREFGTADDFLNKNNQRKHKNEYNL